MLIADKDSASESKSIKSEVTERSESSPSIQSWQKSLSRRFKRAMKDTKMTSAQGRRKNQETKAEAMKTVLKEDQGDRKPAAKPDSRSASGKTKVPPASFAIKQKPPPAQISVDLEADQTEL